MSSTSRQQILMTQKSILSDAGARELMFFAEGEQTSWRGSKSIVWYLSKDSEPPHNFHSALVIRSFSVDFDDSSREPQTKGLGQITT